MGLHVNSEGNSFTHEPVTGAKRTEVLGDLAADEALRLSQFSAESTAVGTADSFYRVSVDSGSERDAIRARLEALGFVAEPKLETERDSAPLVFKKMIKDKVEGVTGQNAS